MSDQEEKDCECPKGKVKNRDGDCVMPAVSFNSLILSLNTTALFHLGDLPHPETGQKVVDLELARHSIDTLIMLEAKTSGNLEKDEEELLDRVLYELKMRFIKAKDERN
ncbi:MAG: DUF1844 domain-containing protein [Candidatus Electrothrix scaldis]|nr:MAG: DUF1844 domain-containing protein [Candidatus Electrothrix sp. GW3-3]